MIQRSSIIFAASLAVLSTLEPTLSFAAAAPAHHRDDTERPRFMKREIKRYLPLSNTTSSSGPNPPFGESSSNLEQLTHTLTTPSPSVTPEVVPETTAAPAITHTTDQGVPHDEQWSRSEFPQSFQQQSQTLPATATTPATSLPPSSNSEQPAKTPTTSAGITESVTLPATSPPVMSRTEGVTTSAVVPTINTETNALPASSLPATSSLVGVATSATIPTANTESNASPVSLLPASSSVVGVAISATIPTAHTESNASPASLLPASSSVVGVATSATIPTVHTESNTSPASVLPASSSVVVVATSETIPTVHTESNASPGSSLVVTSSIIGVPTSATIPIANSKTNTSPANSLPVASSIVGLPASPTIPTANTETNALPTTSPVVNTRTEGTASGSTTPAGIFETSSPAVKSLPGSSEIAGSSPSTLAQSLGGQFSAITPSDHSETPSVAGQSLSQPTATPVAGSSTNVGVQTTTGGVTVRSVTSESQTNTGMASGTRSAGELTAPSFTPQSVPPKTQPGATQQSQATQISAPELSNTPVVSAVEQSISSAGQQSAIGLQTPARSIALGITTPSITQEQPLHTATASVASLTNPSQQPITQPGQTQTIGEGATASHATAPSEATGKTSAANSVAPSITASFLPLSGETIQSSVGNAVPSTNPNTGVPANTKTSQNGLIPTLSASIEASVGASPVASLISVPQPASSPTLPNSAILPTGADSKPLSTQRAGDNSVLASTMQQGTSKAGVFFSASESNPVKSVNSESAEGSTPTGSALYSALTNALQNTVGPGSTMLPNGVVVPTASSAVGAVSQSVQQTEATGKQSGVTEQSGVQAQSTGAVPIVPVPSVTLPGGSLVPNPSASAVVPVASVTLPGGSVVPKPSASAVIPVASVTLPGGSAIPNPLTSAVIPIASVTLPGGSVVPNPSASAVIPEAPDTLSGGSVVPNPSLSGLVPAVSTTVPGGSVVPNPLTSGVVPVASVTLSGETVVSNPSASDTAAPHREEVTSAASVILPVGSLTQSPAATVSDTVLPPIIPASVTLPGGSVIHNPTATLSSSGIPSLSEGLKPIVTPPASSASGVVASNIPISDTASLPAGSNSLSSGLLESSGKAASISNTPQSSGAKPQASVTDSNGAVLPVQTTAPGSTGAVKTGPPTLASGESVTSGVAVASVSNTIPTSISPIIVASASNTNGEVLPMTAGQTTGSATVSGGSVVPLIAATPTAGSGSSPLVVGSATNSNGVALPVTAGQVTGSSTLSGGSVVPVLAATPTAGSGSSPIVVGSATNSNGVGLPITAGQVTGSSTLSGGSVVPLVAATPTAGSGSSPIIVGSATNSNGVALPITAGQLTGSSTLSGGSVIPVFASAPTAAPASGSLILSSAGSGSNSVSGGAVIPNASGNVSPTAASGQATGAAGQTTAGQTAGATGPSGSGVIAPQTELSAPAPVTGTATAPPNAAGTLPAQGTDQHYQTNAKGPFTQLPTGYDTATAQSVPTSILAGPSSMPPSQTSNYASTGLPTGWPLVLYPPDGAVKQPDNTELVQIGFLYPLNYEFVWTHEDSQKQIFKYLPMGIAWGLQIDIENVTMQTLRAWDTTQDLHYVTTLALAFVPRGQVDALGLLVHTPTSKFYHTPDNSTNTLLSMINIALPIAADNRTDGGSTVPGASPSSTATAKDGGAPVGGGIGNSNPVRASSVGIGVGVACGAAAYGAAMFFVARRYKKRRQSHLRSPSMFSSPVMSHVGPDAGAGAALMSGGMGGHRSPSPYHDNGARAASRGSGRSGSTGRQQISAPVMAENSLGWN